LEDLIPDGKPMAKIAVFQKENETYVAGAKN
jgi:hypothetical protein